MKNRGQVAFESLILLLVVISAATIIAGYYLQTHEDSVALSIAKTELLSQINSKNENITLDYLKLEKDGEKNATIIVKTTPNTDFNFNKISSKIQNRVNYKSIIFETE